jgi:hypothetical protein
MNSHNVWNIMSPFNSISVREANQVRNSLKWRQREPVARRGHRHLGGTQTILFPAIDSFTSHTIVTPMRNGDNVHWYSSGFPITGVINRPASACGSGHVQSCCWIASSRFIYYLLGSRNLSWNVIKSIFRRFFFPSSYWFVIKTFWHL